MTFAIFGNTDKVIRAKDKSDILNLLSQYSDTLYIHKPLFDALKRQRILPDHALELDFNADSAISSEILSGSDVAISIGGDGTFLRTAQLVGNTGVPMLGINAGRLGFLADITPEALQGVLESIKNGKITVRQRILLEIKTPALPANVLPYALNDIAVLKHDISSMISIDANVNNAHLTKYQADGLIISTPTGSTAYSLSVGGPIIAPDADVICLTPVAPHSLTMRPLILPGSTAKIQLNVESRSHSFLISVDGQSFSCKEGTPIEITQAPFRINVMKPDDCNFYSTLRHKMMWGTDSRS